MASVNDGWCAFGKVTGVTTLVILLLAGGASAQSNLGWNLVWSDEFNGTNGSAIDSTKWDFDIGGGGWGNNELEYYTNRTTNAYLENGNLIIKAQKENYEGHQYTSARIVSRNKGDWKYGKFEIKAKLPYGQGIWPAIWMMPTDSVYGGWPASGEIDIMELVGNDMDTVYGTMHYYVPPHQQPSRPYNLSGGESFANDYHVFTLEWEQGVIRWYVDGNLFHTQTQWNSSVGPYPAPFDQRFHLILNVAVGGNWPGNPNAATVFPQTMKIDYVRVYQRTSTPAPTANPISSCTNISMQGTYMLTQNIVNSSASTCINITSSNVIFDGAGYTIEGVLSSNTYGVYVYNSASTLLNVTVRNLKVTRWYNGIKYTNTVNGSIANNTASSNVYGINTLTTTNNTLINNTASLNGIGIWLWASSNNTLTNNTMYGNSENFYLFGYSGSSYNNNIDTSNTVEGKPIYYIKNVTNQVYDSSTNVGTFYCIWCSNITIKDLNLKQNSVGIFFWSTNNSRIEKVNASSNSNGIRLDFSTNNTLISNNASMNFNGIMLDSSANNNLTSNTASFNSNRGIYLSFSHNNNLTNNIASSNNFTGIDLWFSSNNTVLNNFFSNTNNFAIANSVNKWNITKTLGTNIIGGPYVGGNFWANPIGTGFSQICSDANSDGICDSLYTLDSSNIDYLPLAYKFTPASAEQWDKTFGGIYEDVASYAKQTSDGGFIIVGYTASYGAGGYDAWVIKTDASGNEQWNKTFGGIGWDEAYSVQQTTDGGYIIAGETNPYGAVYYGWFYAWLIKIDANGNQQWNKTFGGTDNYSAYSVQQTSDGGYITIAGGTGWYGVSQVDAWLIKTDSNGNQQWNKTFGGIGWDEAYSVQQTTDGGYIITGYTSSGAGILDAWLIKTDSNGNQQWSKTFGGTSNDGAYSVQQTTDGGYILAGWTYSFGAGYYDAWLIKTDTNGNEQWNKTFGGIDDDEASSVRQTLDGGYIVGGSSEPYAGIYDPVLLRDIWLIKIDANGNQQWSKTFGGIYDDYSNSVQQTSDGSYIIAGNTRSYGAGSSGPSGTSGDAWLIKVSGGAGATTPINSCTNITSPGTYVLNQNIMNSSASTCIRITSSDVVFDGAGYTIDGVDNVGSYGVYTYNPTTSLTNVTVKNMKTTDWEFSLYYKNVQSGSIKNNTINSNNWRGIYLDSSGNNTIDNNTAHTNAWDGIYLFGSINNTLSGNNLSSNYNGIRIDYSNHNTLINNTANSNSNGIYLYSSSSNRIHHNNIIDNAVQATDDTGTNSWDSGSIGGGNYWSDYVGIDANSDGLGDTPYNISGGAGALDRYPFMQMNGWLSAGALKGDVNGDGAITVVDALFVAQYTVGLRTLTSQQLAAADVNGDGQVTVVDALFIAQYTVGLRQL